MGSSKRWATTISRTASSLYFLLIFFQIPLFRVKCRETLCTTPLELTCSQLLASDVFPASVVKAILYPGAIAKAIFNNKPIPSFNNLPKLYKFIHVKPTAFPLTSDLHRLEVIAGSYLAVGGGVMGMVKAGSGRMSLFGCLIAMWGIVWRKSSNLNPNKEIGQIYPTMFLALLLAFLSVRKDVRRILRQQQKLLQRYHPRSHVVMHCKAQASVVLFSPKTKKTRAISMPVIKQSPNFDVMKTIQVAMN